MLRRLLTMAAVVALPAPAAAVEISHVVGSSTISADFSVQVFTRVRGRGPLDGDISWGFSLQRARLEATFRWDDWLVAKVEPELAGDDADLASVYLQVRPISILDIRLGQSKTPFGALESVGRWDLPVLNRGLSSANIRDRLGFGGRRLGGRIRVRLKKVTTKPTFELGAYSEASANVRVDGALRVGLRPIKGLKIHLAGYSRAGAAANDGYGHAGDLSLTYDRKGTFAVLEGLGGTARALRADGNTSSIDAVFIAVRALASHRFDVGEGFELTPFVAGDLFEPNIEIAKDLGWSARGGLDVSWDRRLRVAFEVDYTDGQAGFVSPSSLTMTVFAGVDLK